MDPIAVYPRLVVDDADAAIAFYRDALGATELARYTTPSGAVVHAELQIGESVVSLTSADGDHNRSPQQLGGTPLLFTLAVPDAHHTARRLSEHGADTLIPVADQYYGFREGRFRDPHGHVWIVSQHLGELDDDEIQRRVDEHEH
jgi:PhnB protein